MLKFVATVLGAALLLNANVASAGKRTYEQKSGMNAIVGVSGELDACTTWSLYSSLSEVSIKDEPGAPEVKNRAILSFFLQDNCANTYSFFDVDLPDIAKLTGNLTGASLDLNQPVTVTSCAYVNEDVGYECTESNKPLKASLKWASTGSPVRYRQHINNLAPDGIRTSFKVDGSTRDSTTTGSVTINGQTFTLTADNVMTSTLTTDAHMYVLMVRK